MALNPATLSTAIYNLWVVDSRNARAATTELTEAQRLDAMKALIDAVANATVSHLLSNAVVVGTSPSGAVAGVIT